MGSCHWGKERAQKPLNKIPLSSLWNQHLRQFSAAAGMLRWAGSCRTECRPACGTALLPECPRSSAPASSRLRFSYAPARLCGRGKRSTSNFAAKSARPKSQPLQTHLWKDTNLAGEFPYTAQAIPGGARVLPETPGSHPDTTSWGEQSSWWGLGDWDSPLRFLG